MPTRTVLTSQKLDIRKYPLCSDPLTISFIWNTNRRSNFPNRDSFPWCFSPFTGGAESPDLNSLTLFPEPVCFSMYLTLLMKNTSQQMQKHEDKAKWLDYLPLGYVASLGAGKISHSLFSGGFITWIRKQIQNYANTSVMSSCYYILDWNRMTSYDDRIKAATETERANESFQVTKSLNTEKHVVGLNCGIWDKNAFFISSALGNWKRCSLIYHPNSFPDSYSLT